MGAAAQQIRSPGTHDFEHKEPFTWVAALRELSDGRLIVIDARENTLQLIDPRTGQATPIGSEGSGPSEWRRPTNVYALPGDSTLLQDPANGRFLILSPNGKPARIFRPEGGGNGTLRATDVRGFMYYQAASLPAVINGQPVFPDSVPVIRYDPVSHRHDTLAHVAVPPRRVSNTTTSSGGVRAVSGVSSPFDPADDWTVMPDGRLVLVRASDYHIEIVGSGAPRMMGRPVPFTPIPVTEADKAQWRQARRNIQPTFRGSDGQPITPPANFQLPEPAWPDKKSAFSVGASRAAPNNEIWVLRHGAANDAPLFDVFNARGERISSVSLPPRTSLVGFGARHMYLVRTDDDDLQHLRRYPLVRN
jgi:hypothetical protein